MEKLKFELEITNSQEILETAQRLAEISKELSALAYRLQVKKGIKKEQPPEATGSCSL